MDLTVKLSPKTICALAGHYDPVAEAYAHGRQGLPPLGRDAAAIETQRAACDRVAAPDAAALSSNQASLKVRSCCTSALKAMPGRSQRRCSQCHASVRLIAELHMQC